MANSLREFISNYRRAGSRDYWLLAGQGFLFLSPGESQEAISLLEKAEEKEGKCIRFNHCDSLTVIGDTELCRRHLERLLFNDVASAIADI